MNAVWKSSDWKATLIKTEDGWSIVAAGEWIIEDCGVCFVITANCNSIQRVIFYFGAGGAITNWVVEVADREQLKSGFGVGFRVVDKFEWSGKFAPKTVRNLI